MTIQYLILILGCLLTWREFTYGDPVRGGIMTVIMVAYTIWFLTREDRK